MSLVFMSACQRRQPSATTHDTAHSTRHHQHRLQPSKACQSMCNASRLFGPARRETTQNKNKKSCVKRVESHGSFLPSHRVSSQSSLEAGASQASRHPQLDLQCRNWSSSSLLLVLQYHEVMSTMLLIAVLQILYPLWSALSKPPSRTSVAFLRLASERSSRDYAPLPVLAHGIGYWDARIATCLWRLTLGTPPARLQTRNGSLCRLPTLHLQPAKLLGPYTLEGVWLV